MKARVRSSFPLFSEDGLPFRFLCFVLLASVLLIFSRRPGDLVHAQFYAEDGKSWFAEAYNLHWIHSLLVPDEGYLHLLARVCTGPALLLPLRWAPLWLNFAGAVVQALPIVVLLSSRCSTWGPLSVRLVMALLYLASPNTEEIHVTLTNAQWHYGLLQFLLAFGTPPKNRLEAGTDIVVFLLGSFTGPFDLVLLPILLLFWWQKRQRWTLVLVACLAVGGAFQLDTMATGVPFGLSQPAQAGSGRAAHANTPLGATVPLFVKIAGGNLFLDGLLGFRDPRRLPFALLLIFLIFGVAIVSFGLYWGPTPFRYFGLYAILLFAAGLRHPLAWDDVSAWHALAKGFGMRYCFMPMLLFVWAGVYAFSQSPVKLVRAACVVLFLLFFLGLRRWVYRPYDDHHFTVYAERFERAAPGTTMQIPLEPWSWFMTLTKH